MGSSRSIRRRDPNTLSNYDQFVTLHTTANLSIDFEQNVLFGNILLDVRVLVNPKENDLILDTRFVDVQDITVDGISSEWSFLPRTEPYGSALRISLENANEANDRLKVDVSLEDMLVFHEAMYLDSIVP
jgi:leukotriene-A4 hydrolase